MPITPERVQKLRDFGLSEYGARAYLALLDLGLTEARDVSNLSKVPQAKIYQILEQLHEKGLVTILPEFPKKYAPVPFSDFLDRMLEEQLQVTRALQRDRTQLAELFSVVGDVDVGDRGDFSIVRGRRNVVETLLKLIDSASRDFFLLGTEGMAGWTDFLREPLERATQRGVRARLLMPHTALTAERLATLAELGEMRARDLEESSQSTRVAIVLVDGARAFLINFVPDDGDLYAGKDMAVSTDQEAMVSAIQTLVEPLWRPATAYASRKSQLESGHPPEFTRLYVTHDEAAAALDEAAARGFGEICALEQADLLVDSEWTSTLLAAARERDADVRLLVHTSGNGQIGLAPLDVDPLRCQLRLLDQRLVSRTWIVGEREAFFAIARTRSEAGDAGDILVHTTNRSALRSICHHFEELWKDARTDVDPGAPSVRMPAATLGALLDMLDEAGLVVDADGRILAGNDALIALVGDRSKASGGMMRDLVVDAELRVQGGRILGLDAGGTLRRHDGGFTDIEASLRPLGDSASHALVVIRPAPKAAPTRPKVR